MSQITMRRSNMYAHHAQFLDHVFEIHKSVDVSDVHYELVKLAIECVRRQWREGYCGATFLRCQSRPHN